MSAPAPQDAVLRVADLPQGAERTFRREPDATARAALAQELGAQALRKLRLEGTLRPDGARGWRLDAMLGATAVQTCVVTLDPVTTRIDVPVARRYVPAAQLPRPEPGSETEMPEDDEIEPLGAVIDLDALIAESLALALPDHPRAPGAELGQTVHAAEGTTPITDEDARPFAALRGLRDRLDGSE